MGTAKNHDSVIIVLHEIYGINQHIQEVCKRWFLDGYDIICPNLIGLPYSFNYGSGDKAYKYFMDNIGFDLAVEQVREVIRKAKIRYKKIYLLGYSIGATIAWLCSCIENINGGIIGFYGSRIRDYIHIVPKCPSLQIFPSEEGTFDVTELASFLKNSKVHVHILKGKHGFADTFSPDFNAESFEKAEQLVYNFLKSPDNNSLG